MNQILFFTDKKNEDKDNNKNTDIFISNGNTNKNTAKKYKLFFCIFVLLVIILSFYLLFDLYNNINKQSLSKKLNSSYSVSTLYSNSSNSNIEFISTNPFVIGILQIDKIKLNYSILSICTDELLAVSICRFDGPMPNEIGNLCIAGHNYIDNSFFGRLDELEIEDIIKIYDLNGNYIQYSIYDIYESDSTDTSCAFQNTNGERIVTLVTCNNVTGKRLILHAKEIP